MFYVPSLDVLAVFGMISNYNSLQMNLLQSTFFFCNYNFFLIFNEVIENNNTIVSYFVEFSKDLFIQRCKL